MAPPEGSARSPAAGSALRHLDVLRRASDIANTAPDLPAAMQEILPLVCEHTGWAIGHALVATDKEPASLVSNGTWYTTTDRPIDTLIEVTARTTFTAGVGLPGMVLKTGAPVAVADVHTVPWFVRVREVPDLPIRGGFGFPVIDNGVVAVLEFYSFKVGRLNDADLELMEHVGRQLSHVAVRDRARRALEEGERRFRSMAHTAADAIIAAGPDSIIIYANPAAESMFKGAPDGLDGRHLTELMPPRYRDAHIAGVERYLAGGAARVIGKTLELEARRLDDTTFPIELTVSSFRSETGIIFTAIIRDITPRKEADARLKATLDRLEASNRDLEQFASVASHDLREPLHAVHSYSQLLERRAKERLDESGRTYLSHITEGVERMEQLIDGLLAYSRARNHGLRRKRVALDQVLGHVRQDLAAVIQERQAIIDIGPLPAVQGDETLLRQALQNLVSNAIKFTPPQQTPRVTVDGARVDDHVEIRVRDEGIGIEPEYREFVFTPFKRLHGRGTYKGTGIGLAIVRRVAERHGGTVHIEDPPSGPGTTFVLRLPDRGASDAARLNSDDPPAGRPENGPVPA